MIRKIEPDENQIRAVRAIATGATIHTINGTISRYQIACANGMESAARIWKRGLLLIALGKADMACSESVYYSAAKSLRDELKAKEEPADSSPRGGK